MAKQKRDQPDIRIPTDQALADSGSVMVRWTERDDDGRVGITIDADYFFEIEERATPDGTRWYGHHLKTPQEDEKEAIALAVRNAVQAAVAEEWLRLHPESGRANKTIKGLRAQLEERSVRIAELEKLVAQGVEKITA